MSCLNTLFSCLFLIPFPNSFFKDCFFLSLDTKAPLFFEPKREELLKLKRDEGVDLAHTLVLYHEVKRDLSLNLSFRSSVPYKSW